MIPEAKTRLLQVENLAVDVDSRKGRVPVITDVSLYVNQGEVLGIVGESGSGKSLTVLNLVRLLPNKVLVTGGRAIFDGRDLMTMTESELEKIRGDAIGFVFQDPMTSLNPVMRIGDQLAEPLIYHQRVSKSAARARAIELLQQVGIPAPQERIDAFPHELSGGMRQRVMIAMGLACQPRLLIADEPTTALDVTIQAQIVELVKRLKDEIGMSVIWITHDLALVAGLADRIMVFYAGRVVEEASTDDLFASPTHPYTVGLIASLPKLTDEYAGRLPSIGGAPPEPGKRPKGCPFAPRCPRAEPGCQEAIPELAAIGGSGSPHRVACLVAQREGKIPR